MTLMLEWGLANDPVVTDNPPVRTNLSDENNLEPTDNLVDADNLAVTNDVVDADNPSVIGDIAASTGKETASKLLHQS